MPIYNIDSNATLSGIVSGTGDTLLFRTSTTFSAASIPAGLLSPNDITVGYYGTGTPPVISGGTVRADWSFDAPNNVYSRPALGGNTLGNVTEDGWPMRFVAWNTNIATTAAAMNSGQSLPYWSGSFTYDFNTNIIYIRPSAGLPSTHLYVVSEALNGFSNSSTARNLRIDGIRFESLSRHAVDLKNKLEPRISNCSFRMIGGVRPASLWLGNGIELALGVWGAETTDCDFSDIFDSPVTSQLYEATPTRIGSHLWQRLTMQRYGLTGVEISCQTTNGQVISDVETADITSADQGANSWAGDRNGQVLSHLTQGGTSQVTRCFASRINSTNHRRLYLGFRHGGVCGIEDSTGTGAYFQGPRADRDTGLNPQRDLMRNVVDNLARVGDSWVDSTANMSDWFRSAII
jgi:hypothetical protein